MPLLQFSARDIQRAKIYPKTEPRQVKSKKKRKIFKCSIDGYNLRIGPNKISKTWAIKFAKWILKSFDKIDG